MFLMEFDAMLEAREAPSPKIPDAREKEDDGTTFSLPTRFSPKIAIVSYSS